MLVVALACCVYRTMMTPMSTINKPWFDQRLAEKHLSQRRLARLMKLDQSAISLTLSGKRRMKFEEAAGIARLIGYPVSEVLRNAGVPVEEGRQRVPVAGWLDGMGEIHCLPMDDAQRVLTPQPMPEGSVAVQCRTAASPLEYMDGWLLFREPPVQPPPLGQFAVVQIAGGIRTIGTLRRGYRKGRLNLSGPCCSITDAAVEWAAPITAIRTDEA